MVDFPKFGHTYSLQGWNLILWQTKSFKTKKGAFFLQSSPYILRWEMAQLIYEAIKQLELFKSGFCSWLHVCTAWKVTLELIESSYLWSPCGEQICLTHYIHFNTMVQCHFQLVISGESKLDASSFKRLKTEVGVLQYVNYSRWSCGFNYVIVSRL